MAGEQDTFQSHSEWFEAFLRNTDQKQVQTQTTLQGLQRLFPESWDGVVTNGFKPFSILCVGVGNGGFEIPLIQEIILRRGTSNGISIYCEDVSPQLRDAFYKAAKTSSIDGLVKEYRQEAFEDPLYQPPSVDFATAAHVWYYIPEWQRVDTGKNTLMKFARSISEKHGVGLITMHSETSDRFQLKSKYSPRIGQKTEAFGEEVVEELNRLGLHVNHQVVDAHLDLASCFQSGRFDPTEEGADLLSWVFRSSWREFDDQLRQEMSEDIQSLVDKNKKPQLVLRDSYIWIQK